MVELLVVMAVLSILAVVLLQDLGGVSGEARLIAAKATLHMVREAFCGTAGAAGYLADMKFVPGFSNSTMRIGHLLVAPTNYPAFANYDTSSQRGWRGPYVQNVQPVANTNVALAGFFPLAGDRRSDADDTFFQRKFFPTDAPTAYGTTNDPALADPWGNPIVLQWPTNSLPDEVLLRFARLVSAGPNGVLDTPRDRLASRQADGTCTARVDDLVLFLNRADVFEND